MTTEEIIQKKVAIKALNYFKRRIGSYPSVVGAGLTKKVHKIRGKKVPKYMVVLYVNEEKRIALGRKARKLPKNLLVKSRVNGEKITKIPTLVENVGNIKVASL